MDKKKIKTITKILKKNKNYIEEKDTIIEYLNNGYYIFSDDFLYELIEFIIKNELSIKVIEKAKELYNIIIFNNRK